jgi:UDP-N-acetylmuramoyl-tripeptide--D-alanyl-D-alanine ligase
MSIFRKIKKYAYFFVARYFALWASLFLNRWKPRVITVIGSSGKTTLLHLFEAELGGKQGKTAVFSHKANSAFGIPFHILGLERKTFAISEWFFLIAAAPFKIFRAVPSEKIYVTEADAERPGEGKLLAKLLRPHAVVWLSLEEAHGVNYDSLVNAFAPQKTTVPVDARTAVRKVMAAEFGYFMEAARDVAVLNAGNPYIMSQRSRTHAALALISQKDISDVKILQNGITFSAGQRTFSLPLLVPVDVALSALAVAKVVEDYLHFPFDPTFADLSLPPSRSSVLQGKNNTVLIDSSYNATFDGMRAMLDLISKYPASGERWLVLGDMIEQGKSEELEHIDLAAMIIAAKPDRIVLVGPRLQKYTYPLLVAQLGKASVVSYLMPAEALAYLEKELRGGETILFKGARYLEGVVEKMLLDPQDSAQLCRREDIWVKRRKQWGI